jgi:hypothetical protein
MPSDAHSKIPKPPGAVTRITRGGYSLKKELRWDPTQYEAVQVSTLLATFTVPVLTT